MNTIDDPIDPRQRRQALVLGLGLGAACLALMVACIIMFSTNGLPKDPKEWKRLQEQRSAAGTASDQPEKDQTR